MQNLLSTRIGRFAALVAAIVLPVAAAYALAFSDATADQLWGSASFTDDEMDAAVAASDTRFVEPFDVAFDGRGNLIAATDTAVLIFVSPTSDTLNGRHDQAITIVAIDSSQSLNVDTLFRPAGVVVTTTETDVLWVTSGDTNRTASPVGSGHNYVAGIFLNSTTDTLNVETSVVRGRAGDTVADIILGDIEANGVQGFNTAAANTANDSNFGAPIGITAREAGGTITLFVADRAFNRVVGIFIQGTKLGNVVFSQNQTVSGTNGDTRFDIVLGQDTFTAQAEGTDNRSTRAPRDVSWGANALFIADVGNTRVVAADLIRDASTDSLIEDTFGSPFTQAIGDTNGNFNDAFQGFASSDSSFVNLRGIVTDGVGIGAADTPAATLSGKVLVFNLNGTSTDTQADNGVGGTLNTTSRTFTNNAVGISATQFGTVNGFGGNGSLVVLPDQELNRLLGFAGTFGGGDAPSTGDGGSCLLEAALTGTSLEAALPAIRGARDTALGSSVGRFLASAYYSVFGLVALVALAGAAAALAYRKGE